MYEITDSSIEYAEGVTVKLLQKYKLPISEDALQEGFLGLCVAANRFESSRIDPAYQDKAFRVLAYLCIKDRILRFFWGVGTQKPRGVRLERYLFNRTQDINTIANLIEYSTNKTEWRIINKDLCHKLLQVLSPDQYGAVVDYFYNNLTPKEMAERGDICRRAYNQRLLEGLRKMRAVYRELD